MISVLGLVWAGTYTEAFEAMCKLYEDVFHLRQIKKGDDFAAYRTVNGDVVQVFGPAHEHNELFTTGPVVGFAVPDVEAARAQMEQHGIEFIGDIHGDPERYQWSHFRGPDGNIYEIAGYKPWPT